MAQKDNTQYKIILFPEFLNLKTEIQKLRTEISMLLLERDELQLVICKNIETAYILALGSLEYNAFEIHCNILRIKRKISLIQAKKNCQEKIDIQVIEKILDKEFATFKLQLDEQVDKMNEAFNHSKAIPLSDEETKEIKKLYRSIAKTLHPDINPNVSLAQIKLFQNAVQAYENGDLDSLRIIWEMVDTSNVLEDSEDTLSVLLKDKERLTNILKQIKEQICDIKSKYPYTMKDLVNDIKQIDKKRTELKNTIEKLKETQHLYSLRLKELLR